MRLGLALVLGVWVLALPLSRRAVNEDIYSALLGVCGALVVIVGVGEFRDDVPGV